MSPYPFSIKTLFVLVDDRINNKGLFFLRGKKWNAGQFYKHVWNSTYSKKNELQNLLLTWPY